MNELIQTIHLSKSFNGIKAVDDVNLNVPKGSIYGFLGPNGAGKTTTLKMLTGMLKPDVGDVIINHEKMIYGSYEQTKNIGFLPDVPEYYNWMNAKEFLKLCGKLFGIDNHELDKRIHELLELTGINTNKKISGYSRGMKQRLGIAQALINNPEVVFLDEPTSALDPLGRKEILDLIYCLKEKATVFFSTHILTDVERICDRIAIMNEGKVILEDTVAGIKGKHLNNKVQLRTNQNSLAREVFSHESWVREIVGDGELIIEVKELELAHIEIPRILFQNQMQLIEFKVVEPSLEDIFMKVVNGN